MAVSQGPRFRRMRLDERRTTLHYASDAKKAPDKSGAWFFKSRQIPAVLLRLADRNLERADAIDAAFDFIAGVELGDAGRRSRHDDVAGSKRDLLRKLPDDLRPVPDQFGEAALLGFG